jgi:hypothetical protein
MAVSAQWSHLPAGARALIGQLAGGPVIATRSGGGGFSPGFAARLVLADRRHVFVKAVDAGRWPLEAEVLRAEASVAAALPSSVAAPAFLGCADDGRWVALAFAEVDGCAPEQPWRPDQLDLVLAAVSRLAPEQVPLGRDHPRLGGWSSLAGPPGSLDPWAAAALPRLIELEAEGLAAAQGTALVHFDLRPGTVLLGAGGVTFVDWAHARRGSPLVDPIVLLARAAGEGVDAEALLAFHTPGAEAERASVTAVLAAYAGFLAAGALAPAPPGFETITAANVALARGALSWLRTRLVEDGQRRARRHGRHR